MGCRTNVLPPKVVGPGWGVNPPATTLDGDRYSVVNVGIDGSNIVSRLKKSSPLWELLYGDDEGRVAVGPGSVTYSFNTDRFQIFDGEGIRVYGMDEPQAIEAWLVREGWVQS